MKTIPLVLIIWLCANNEMLAGNSSCDCGQNFDQTSLEKIDSFDLGISLQLNFHFNRKGSSNFSMSMGVAVSKSIEINKTVSTLIPTYQLNTNFYSNGIGTNLHRDRRKLQVDFINSLGLTWGAGLLKDKPYFNEIQTFNSMNSPILNQKYYKFSSTIASNFILNVRNRNQQVGFFGMDIWKTLKFGYYNDGPFFDKVGFGDSYDRWWTGGGFVEFDPQILIEGTYKRILKKPIPKQLCYFCKLKFRATYDRFTGNVQDAYRAASSLGLSNVPPADENESLYNRGFVKFALRHEDGWALQYSILAPNNDVQDLIHDIMKISHHFSAAKREVLWGFEFDYNFLNTRFFSPN